MIAAVILARIKGWLAALAVGVALLFGAWFKGRSSGRAEAKANEDEDYRNTRERIDNAGKDTGSLDRDSLDRRLREHTKR